MVVGRSKGIEAKGVVADVAWLKVVDYSGATMSGVAMRSVISHVIVSAVAKCSRKGAAVVLTGGLDKDGDRQWRRW